MMSRCATGPSCCWLELLLDIHNRPRVEAAKDQVISEQDGWLKAGRGHARASGCSLLVDMLSNFRGNLLSLFQCGCGLEQVAAHDGAGANMEIRPKLFLVFLSRQFHCVIHGRRDVFGCNYLWTIAG